MGRLIDADALKQDLRKCQIESLIAHSEEKNVFDVINEQPTAFDREKVVAELEEKQIDINGNTSLHYLYSEGYSDAIDYSIDIVKRGGVE